MKALSFRAAGIRMVTLVLISSLTLITACDQTQAPVSEDPIDGSLEKSNVKAMLFAGTGDYPSDVANDWIATSYDVVKTEALSPPLASRIYGYESVALYEAIVGGMPNNQSLSGQLNGLKNVPQVNPNLEYHWPTVANHALARVLYLLFEGRPNAQATILAKMDEIDRSFKGTVDNGVFQRSANHGKMVGRHIYNWSKKDGFATRSTSYTPCTDDYCWQPTPPGFLPALEPGWGQLRTFVMADGGSADPGDYPAYSEDPASEFYAAGLEVYNTVNNLTAEQQTIANYWGDGPGVTGTPPGHSMAITRQVIEQQGFDLAVAAEGYARAGISVADAFICCWWCKYNYHLMRPVTYIHRVIDPSWLPYLTTPNFPGYTSGHSTQSGAWAQAMTDYFGNIPFTDHTHDSRGFAPRSFNTWFEAAEEAAVSRLYGGIHFTFDNDNGLTGGIMIGQTVTGLNWTATAGQPVMAGAQY
jgi:hypothetical protein